MKWYLVKIVYRILCGEGTHISQFDEQLRLINAVNEEEAFDKATTIGKKEEEVFYNKAQQLVQWKFINVSELYYLSTLIDGAEVYSRIKEVDDGESYTNFVHHKAKLIQEKYTLQLLNLI